MEKIKKIKKLVEWCKIFVGVLALYNFVEAFYLMYKGAVETGFISLIISFMNYAWFMFYRSQLQNMELSELVDRTIEVADFFNKTSSELYTARQDDITLFNKRSEATAEELEKIIELSQKRMVNGLPEERYTCFINEVLHAIHGFAERAKHNLLNRTYEVKENEKI